MEHQSHHHFHSKNRRHDDYEHKYRNLIASSVVIGVIFLAELIGGLISGSLALLSDAGHMFMDLASLIISLIFLGISARKPTKRRTYGYHRVEVVSSLINVGLLLFVVVGIVYEAIRRLNNPVAINSAQMFIVATIGLIANIIVIFKLHHHKDLNIKGAFFHVVGDTLSSVAVVAGAIIIHFTGFNIIDPLLSLIVALIIALFSYRLMGDIYNIIIEGAPREVKFSDVIREMKDVDGVRDVHSVHLWVLCSGINALSAHVYTSRKKIAETEPIIEELNRRLSKYDIKYTNFQFESRECRNKHKVRILH